MIHKSFILLTLVTLGLTQMTTAQAPSATEVDMGVCVVDLLDDVEVSAEQPGVLRAVNFKDGQLVKPGDVLAQIDDSEARLAERVARMKLDVAAEEVRNDVDIRHARAAARVAESDYLEAVEANRRVARTVSSAEIRYKLFTWRRSELEIEQAEFGRGVARKTVEVRQAELEQATNNIKLRKIASTLDGIVEEVFRDPGEWVQPGDPVMRVVRLDKVRIEGMVQEQLYSPEQVMGRSVTITYKRPGKPTETFTGRISFISSDVQSNGEYQVSVEVDNRKKGDFWILRKGTSTTAKISL